MYLYTLINIILKQFRIIKSIMSQKIIFQVTIFIKRLVWIKYNMWKYANGLKKNGTLGFTSTEKMAVFYCFGLGLGDDV